MGTASITAKELRAYKKKTNSLKARFDEKWTLFNKRMRRYEGMAGEDRARQIRADKKLDALTDECIDLRLKLDFRIKTQKEYELNVEEDADEDSG